MLRSKDGAVMLALRIQPGAKRTAVAGVWGEGDDTALKIAVQAPPIEGRSNEAVIAFVANELGVAKSRVSIVQGKLSRSKVVRLEGVELAAVEAWVAGVLG